MGYKVRHSLAIKRAAQWRPHKCPRKATEQRYRLPAHPDSQSPSTALERLWRRSKQSARAGHREPSHILRQPTPDLRSATGGPWGISGLRGSEGLPRTNIPNLGRGRLRRAYGNLPATAMPYYGGRAEEAPEGKLEALAVMPEDPAVQWDS
jgi:hypothetical protein